MPVECPNSLVAFFPPEVYNHHGSDAVLPRLLEMLGRPNLVAVQFLRHGTVRLTFKDSVSCDRVLLEGLTFDGHSIRLTPIDQRSKLVYVRDLPSEVPDGTVRTALAVFGEVHSITRSEHRGFPGLFDGSRVVKMSLAKDIPPVFRIAGYDCRTWYRRQPQWCPICRTPGHRARECPMNGVCRRCRQPGHVARECRQAWGGPTPNRPRSRAPASAEPAAPGPTAPVEVASSSPPGDASAMEVAESPSVASGVTDSGSPGEVSLSGSAVGVSGDLCSGDEEVIAAAPAVVIDAPRSSRNNRKRKPAPAPQSSGDESPTPKTMVLEVESPASSPDQQQRDQQPSPELPAPPLNQSSADASLPKPTAVLPSPPCGLLDQRLSALSPASGAATMSPQDFTTLLEAYDWTAEDYVKMLASISPPH